MKKKNQLSKQPINLMPYRLKSQDSLDFISNPHPYHPKFIYELISSPDNSFSQMIKDFRSKGQQYKKVPIFDHDFQGPSSIHPEIERVKIGLGEENVRLQGEVRGLIAKNEELLVEVEYLREKVESMRDGSEFNEEIVRKLERELKLERERQYPNQQKVEDLMVENEYLKQEITSLQNNLRRLKQNRSITRATHDSTRDTKEVYQNVTLYLKGRVEVLLNDMKNIVMSSKLESMLEDFLEEILLINEFTVNKMKRRQAEEVEEREREETVLLPYSMERVRLDKSIEKLKQIEREVAKEEKEASGVRRNTVVSMNFLTEVKMKDKEREKERERERERSRSKSVRKRIFGHN